MTLSLIVACGLDNEIGKDGRMPWHLPADLKHFKALTLGKPVLMGRRTFQSIGRPLPRRRNIVVTTDKAFRAEGCELAHSVGEGMQLAGAVAEIMVIGGGEIYRRVWSQAQRIHITRIYARFDADTFFPETDPAEWRETAREEHGADARNPFDYAFIILERVFGCG